MGLPVEINPLLISSSGYTVGRSLRFRSSASAYLNRTPASASNRTTWTWSGWVKRGTLGASQYGIFSAGTNNSNHTSFYFTSDAIGYQSYSGGVAQWNVATNAVYRDPSAWYHLVVVTDTSNATSSNRILIYINGVSQSFSTASYPTSGTQGFVNQNNEHDLARLVYASGYSDLYFAEVNFIDGQALTPSSFGAYDTNGVWQPLKYGGTYGTNGFYLPFSDTTSTTTLCYDKSGNGNNWTPNNISLTAGTTYDSMIDSPTNAAGTSTGIGNYAVWNPLFNYTNKTITDGNLNFYNTTTASPSLSTIGVNSGKWYAEFTFETTYCNVGIANANLALSNYIGSDTNGFGLLSTNGSLYYNATAYTYGSSFTTSDTMMLAFDVDNKKIYWGKNGTWFNSGNPATGTNPGVAPSGGTVTATIDTTQLWFFATGTTSLPNGSIINFGQRPFSYTPPSGYSALNTYNLPTPTIPNGAAYMAATTYTANGGVQTINNSTNTTIGTTFKPDLVWTKTRSTTGNNYLIDSVRGVGLDLYSNLTNAETSDPNYLTAFNSNGFSIGSANYANGTTLVGWQWQAGAGSSSSNTSGSITSTVSANTTAGFSVVTYTGNGTNGATIGHGLGVAPNMILFKARNSAIGWDVYHSSVGNTAALTLNSTGAAFTSSTFFNNTSPSSTVITLGTDANLNGNTTTFVAYCFAAVRGYSAFGSYTGNGSSDGAFVYTGFRPRYVMVKSTNTAESWVIWDSSRGPYNVILPALFAQSTNAESASTQIDFLSNGFKLRNSVDNGNVSGTNYIYMAFAENPYNYSRAR